MEKDVSVESDGLKLFATLYMPDNHKGSLPGIVLGHGFAGARYPKMSKYLADHGYAVLSIDFRGYGKSEGERGRVVPADQVSDFKNSLDWLQKQPGVDANRLGIIGSSLGGSIAIMAAAQDDRIKVCVSGCPIAKGDSTFRLQYDTQEKFEAFMKRVDEAAAKKEKLHRFEIVHIPENLRTNLPPGTPMEFSTDTVYGFLSLNPLEAIKSIAPRPVYIVHAKDDHVVPFEDAEALAALGGESTELVLVDAGDHFIFTDDDIISSITAWLEKKLPSKAA